MSDTPAAAPPAKSKKSLMMIVLALVVLGGGGAGAYFFYFKAPPAEAGAEEPAEEEPAEAEGGGIVPLEPFVVNLADAGTGNFLRVTVGLVVPDEEVAKEVEENALDTAKIRSSILELLAQQSADVLATPEGKEELKVAIAETATEAVHHLKVKDVLFTEFVIQY